LRNRDDIKGMTCKTYGADEKFIEILTRKPEVERPLSEEPDVDVWILFSYSCTGLDRSWAFQEFEAPRFQDMKVVRLSALRNGRLYPPEIIAGTQCC